MVGPPTINPYQEIGGSNLRRLRKNLINNQAICLHSNRNPCTRYVLLPSPGPAFNPPPAKVDLMQIIRVFPRKTSFTPTDDLAFVGEHPLPLFMPKADEVHVSVAFSWDVEEGYRLKSWWEQFYSVVKIGGPAFGGYQEQSIPGMYIKSGVTFTTRGCNNNCPWCLVPSREGKLIELLGYSDGWIIQDNNLLQASHRHIEKVMTMLRRQKKAALFSGGLQANLVDDWFVVQLQGIRVESVFLAADTAGALKPLERALENLSFLKRKKLRVYCMIGRAETLVQAKGRLDAIWELGGLPFAQLYQPPDKFIDYSREWKALAREWSRPAAMFANHK